MTATPLHWRSVSRLAEELRSGSLSAEHLTRHYLERIADLDGRLCAFRVVDAERAIEQARRSSRLLASGGAGPLCGIPFAAKDLFDVEGMTTGAGTRLLEDTAPATRSAAVVRRLEEAGMVLLGKTHTVQLAYGGVGINNDVGTPRNPWRQEPSVAGGSSSGSAVAVASGMAPIALGTDTGGSVRIPAALCGLVGLKTTVGRVSRAGVHPLSWSLDSVGPLARSVEDAALLCDAISGPDDEDPTTWGRQATTLGVDLAKHADADLSGVRIGLVENVFFDEASREIATAIHESAEVFEGLGAVVERIELDTVRKALELNPRGLVIAAEAYTLNRRLVDGHLDALDPVVGGRIILGKDVTAEEYLETVKSWQRLRAEARLEMSAYDALLCPTTARASVPIADLQVSAEAYRTANLLYLRNTSIGNILDLCGLSVPCGFTETGLPIGLMIYGGSFDESTIARLGRAYESATSWQEQRPDLSWIERG